jgi:hypothetical protein
MMENQSPTDFSGLANPGLAAHVYSGLSDVTEATKRGEYGQNRPGIQKPWILPVYKPPDVKPIA